ncbi:DTNBP1 isoform 9 [Pan troglodytes]|uniref:DTNBP1 isoform 3 n=1 Tax=Pan troglodytes TaxID=9598 RepID=A0A2J8MTB9_PANTR|nr:DTNBP1 isoform 3 [Pan troglodytes]PNI62766.1 DTNBP1 isoform 9 [Pan troglodytes]
MLETLRERLLSVQQDFTSGSLSADKPLVCQCVPLACHLVEKQLISK